MSFRTMSIRKFRESVEAIEDDTSRDLIKINYLLASRASELCNKTTPMELLRGSSRPYGVFMSYKLMDFELTPQEDPTLKNAIKEKAFVIMSAVAKRGKHIKRTFEEDEEPKQVEVTAEEIKEALTKYRQLDLLKQWEKGEVKIDPLLIKALLGKMVFKAIALPVSLEYEPWTYDLLKFYQKNRKLTFDRTRFWVHDKYRAGMTKILPPTNKHSPKNPLRHYRLSHLLEYYQFDAVQLSNYSGWTMQTAFGMQGMKASSNIDFYIHLMWRQYFPKLLRPIAQLK